jgi:hypothetical protein
MFGMAGPKLYRDASDRLSFSASNISMQEYPAVCSALADALRIVSSSDLVTDMVSVIFRDYSRGEQVVELSWDDWMEFTVAAKTPESDSLVEEIAIWLIERQPPNPDGPSESN